MLCKADSERDTQAPSLNVGMYRWSGGSDNVDTDAVAHMLHSVASPDVENAPLGAIDEDVAPVRVLDLQYSELDQQSGNGRQREQHASCQGEVAQLLPPYQTRDGIFAYCKTCNPSRVPQLYAWSLGRLGSLAFESLSPIPAAGQSTR